MKNCSYDSLSIPFTIYPLPERAMIRFRTVRDVVLACVEICHHSCTHIPAFHVASYCIALFIIIFPRALAVPLLNVFAHDCHRRATLHTAYCIKLYHVFHSLAFVIVSVQKQHVCL